MEPITDEMQENFGARIASTSSIDPSLFFELDNRRYISWPNLSTFRHHGLKENTFAAVTHVPEDYQDDID
ncbi:hypothetical protein CJF32_00006230 [Rutstroemia sp. NJR-2017a WRK4]|nr:hypothetical protein CJF32_00006230 [Rutstroemia sp. NJR-2017a WRK4]